MNRGWVPMKWPCGPLDAARIGKAKGVDPAVLHAAAAWTEPAALQLLRGTPVNCLVVSWAMGLPEDEAQQLALQPLIRAGRQLGLSFAGRVTAKANQHAALAAGRAAGLEAVIVDEPVGPAAALPAIVNFASDGINWERASQIFCATSDMWPGIHLETMEGDTARGGPTGIPWVNSSGWLSLLARRMAAGKTFWLDIDPPADAQRLSAEDYCRAIADSRIYGSRWILSLDGALRAGLAKQDADALTAWARICGTLAFFEDHAAWDSYQPMGALAVVSDFAAQNAFTGGEVLNLLLRRQAQFVILDRPRALADPVPGLKGILWMDDEPPDAEQQRRLLSFVREGGLLIAQKYWGPSGITPHTEDWLIDYQIYKVDEGRMVVAEHGYPDPYQLARDAHLLVGHRHDVARLYNPETSNCYASLDPAGRRQVVQIVNYGQDPVGYLALWVHAEAQAGRLWIPHADTPRPLRALAGGDGTSFDLPPLAVHCAVEMERMA